MKPFRRQSILFIVILAAAIAVAPRAQAVIVVHNDEEALDLVLLPDSQSAQLTLTENLPIGVADARRDQLNHGATEQTATRWQIWAEKHPFFYTWAASNSLLKAAIPRIMQSASIQRVSVQVYFVAPDADNPQQLHLFESFDCGTDCSSGTLPDRPTLSPWAVEVLRDEVHRNTTK